MHMEAFVPRHPSLDALVLVRGVVIADDVDLLFSAGYRLIDQAQEFQPLLMPVALLAQVDRPLRWRCSARQRA